MLRATLHEREIRRAVGLPEEGDLIVEGLATIDAPEDGCLYFVNGLVTPEISAAFAERTGCVVILPLDAKPVDLPRGVRVLQVAAPREAIAKVLGFIRSERRQPPYVTAGRIDPGAFVSPLAVIEADVIVEEGARIEAFCTVGPGATIGRHTVIRAGARIGSRVSIGDYSVIGANAVIGSEGYGFVRDAAGEKTRIPHLGGVSIGSHVEIGALTVIQLGMLRPTVIEDYAKIDDNVEVGHHARVGRGASVLGGVMLGGEAVIGPDAWLGMNATIRNGRQVGEGALVGMSASIQDDLAPRAIARAPRPAVAERDADDDPRSIGFQKR